MDASFGPFNFNWEFAIEHEGIPYIVPDTDVLQHLMRAVLDDDRGEVGLKLLPFVNRPGMTYNYPVAFEDGTGEIIQEETIPVFVEVEHHDPQRTLDERVVESDTVTA